MLRDFNTSFSVTNRKGKYTISKDIDLNKMYK